MAVDMFIKLDGIKGEAIDSKHKDEIDVLAWSWGISQSGTFHRGSGGGAGKANVQDISLTKYIDKASAPLFKSCANGQHIKEALLTVRKAGKDPLEYITIKLSPVIVTNVSVGGSGGEDRLTENVTLNFGKVEYTYKSQKPDGSPGDTMPFSYDVQQNKVS
ncbi:MAG: type VI secretion system tube protein Hcp [Desulfobacteraceae bacterium]|nr:MAG: type VI secretion system tube protein Hcp [Desulfobacteraceae bacterium]